MTERRLMIKFLELGLLNCTSYPLDLPPELFLLSLLPYLAQADSCDIQGVVVALGKGLVCQGVQILSGRLRSWLWGLGGGCYKNRHSDSGDGNSTRTHTRGQRVLMEEEIELRNWKDLKLV